MLDKMFSMYCDPNFGQKITGSSFLSIEHIVTPFLFKAVNSSNFSLLELLNKMYGRLGRSQRNCSLIFEN